MKKPPGFWRRDVVDPALRHEVDMAVAEQEAILAHEPGNAPAHCHLGVLAHFRGETQMALNYFQRALDLDPNYPEPHVHLGRILIVQGKFEEARQHALAAALLGDRALLEQIERYANIK